MRITERDLRLFHFLAKFSYAESKDIANIVGWSSIIECNKRLGILTKENYLSRSRVFYGKGYIYTVKNKGLKLIGATISELHIGSSMQLQHDIYCSKAVYWIMQKHNIDFFEITSEKEAKKSFPTKMNFANWQGYFTGKSEEYIQENMLDISREPQAIKFPDLWIEDLGLVYEIELTQKSYQKFRKKWNSVFYQAMGISGITYFMDIPNTKARNDIKREWKNQVLPLSEII